MEVEEGPTVYTPRLTIPLWRLDAARKWRRIQRFLSQATSVLEIGSGPGTVVERLRQEGLQVTALDVEDTAVSADLRPVLYDGIRMPFEDQSFDVALVLTVLHHAQSPEAVLSEAGRVAKRVIVMEDVYERPWQQKVTHWADSIANFEFRQHPHNNRTDDHWHETFFSLGLKVIASGSEPFLGCFRQSVYVLEGRQP